MQKLDRDMLLLLLFAMGTGVVIGLLLAPRGNRDSSRYEDNRSDSRVNRPRASSNFVVGNIVINSNNASRASMRFGNEDQSENN
ncbi:MAG: hypothetical protein AAF125_24515 [Chloroflexota bacterium]